MFLSYHNNLCAAIFYPTLMIQFFVILIYFVLLFTGTRFLLYSCTFTGYATLMYSETENELFNMEDETLEWLHHCTPTT